MNVLWYLQPPLNGALGFCDLGPGVQYSQCDGYLLYLWYTSFTSANIYASTGSSVVVSFQALILSTSVAVVGLSSLPVKSSSMK